MFNLKKLSIGSSHAFMCTFKIVPKRAALFYFSERES